MRRSGKKTKATSWIEIHFGEVSDTRKRIERAEYSPISILVIALAGALCGIEVWDDLHDFAEAKEDWLRSVADLPDSLPSADTIRRVLGALDPVEFETAFRKWVQAIAGSVEGEVVAIDGKSVRGAFGKGQRTPPLHLLHAWATEQRVLLGFKPVDGALSESSEIPSMFEKMMIDACLTGMPDRLTASAVVLVRRTVANDSRRPS
ncbi:MAG: ISAs1 family transposase [Myxococcales bacterium]|nr:ISAs1 family transposase [Myxococcales bacterium]